MTRRTTPIASPTELMSSASRMPRGASGRIVAPVVLVLTLAAGLPVLFRLFPFGGDGGDGPVSTVDTEASGAMRLPDGTSAPWKELAHLRRSVNDGVASSAGILIPEWIGPPGDPTDTPPQHMGRTLDAGGPGLDPAPRGRGSAVAPRSTIDADDPQVYAPAVPASTARRDIGDPLDAGGPGSLSWFGSGPLSQPSGYDAGFPRREGSDESLLGVVEIGELLDAGGTDFR